MLRLSPKLKRHLRLILPFGIIWLISGWVFLWSEYAVISVMEEQTVPDSAITITPVIFLYSSVAVFFVGCLVGLIETTFINALFERYSFPIKLFGKLLFYVVLMLVIMFVLFCYAVSIELDISVFSETVFKRYKAYFFSVTNVSTSVQLSFSLVLSLLYAEVSDNLGHGVMLNFFTGKYHKPVAEQRLFMFTDMKSSTKIAEELGHVRYFDYLKHYYNDLSDAIIKHQGEVYQYIGDEIVISWNLKKEGVIRKSLDCFFAMKDGILRRKSWYLETYGLFPDFKAGLHMGEVTTGEIGALKKEIFFTGDVLNTTARIQGLCKQYNTDLLLSNALVEQLNNLEDYEVHLKGQTKLKGKTYDMTLFTVVKKD